MSRLWSMCPVVQAAQGCNGDSMPQANPAAIASTHVHAQRTGTHAEHSLPPCPARQTHCRGEVLPGANVVNAPAGLVLLQAMQAATVAFVADGCVAAARASSRDNGCFGGPGL